MSLITNFINLFRGRTTYISGSGVHSRPRDMRLEQNEIISGILDANATQIARGRVVHARVDGTGRIIEMKTNSEYTKLFNRPNPIMSRQDFLYSMAWQLQISNTAIAWVKWDAAMHPLEMYPLVYLEFEYRKTEGGKDAVLITDFDGKRYTVLAEDLIVIRRKYNGNGFAGSDNRQIGGALEIVSNLDEALTQAVQISNKIHGILKSKNSMLNLNSTGVQKSFVERAKEAAENGGIVQLDAMEEYQPLSVSTWAASAEQLAQVYRRVYTYWRTPEEVVSNTANEQTMQNYFDSVVEPVWEEMAEAFTNALFNRREQDFGNKMIVYAGMATGASWKTKLSIVTNTKDMGLLTINEYRELLGYSPIEDGDDRLVSLNYVKSEDQSMYQTGKEGKNEPAEDDGENE